MNQTNDRFHIIQRGSEAAGVLYAPSETIVQITPELLQVAKGMAITLQATNGVGLAAPQVGVSKRLIVVKRNQAYVVMFNPVIIKRSEKLKPSKEGCLSIKQGMKYYDLERHRTVKVAYTDINGAPQKLKAAARLSYCIQHEVDHLDGILISTKGAKS